MHFSVIIGILLQMGITLTSVHWHTPVNSILHQRRVVSPSVEVGMFQMCVASAE